MRVWRLKLAIQFIPTSVGLALYPHHSAKKDKIEVPEDNNENQNSEEKTDDQQNDQNKPVGGVKGFFKKIVGFFEEL